MLLIVSNSTDATADFAEPEIARRGQPYWRLDTDTYPHDARLTLRRDCALLATREATIDISEVRVVWWRRPTPPQISGRADAVNRWASEEARLALDGAFRTMNSHWVNHPDANRPAQDKVTQLRRAEQLDFAVPDWLVTNDPATALEFGERHLGGVVAKPMGTGRIDDARTFWTSRVQQDDLTTLGPEPYLLERFIERRADLRITVVGEEVFAVSIDSSEHPQAHDDWRRAGLSAHHDVVTLDPATASRCLALTQSFGLSFAAIDLAIDLEGRAWFLEINPNGQWAWLEQATGVPIAASLAGLFQRYG